jgi:hypothetical protein
MINKKNENRTVTVLKWAEYLGILASFNFNFILGFGATIIVVVALYILFSGVYIIAYVWLMAALLLLVLQWLLNVIQTPRGGGKKSE